MKKLATIVALFWLVVPVLRVEATIINVPIANFSFETPDASGPPGYTINATTPTPGWNWTGTSGAFYIPGQAPDGNQVGWMFRSTLWQQTPAQLAAGFTYQLTLAVARDTSAFAVTNTYALYSGNTFTGGTLLASGTIVPPAPAQTFQNVTLTFGPSDPNYATLLAAHAGENIIVAFTADNVSSGSADIDNVQLLEIIPEPSALLLFGVGGMLVWRMRTRKEN